MSILLLSPAQAADATFDVSAGLEGTAHATSEQVGLAGRQVELGARLGVGSFGARVDLDLLDPGVGFVEGIAATPSVFPEQAWAALTLAGGWQLAAGTRPLDVPGEAVDGWNNPLVPYSLGYERAGGQHQVLGGWAEGPLGQVVTGGLHGGVLANHAAGIVADVPLVGGALGIGEEARLKAALSVAVGEDAFQGTIEGALPIGEAAELSAAFWLISGPDAPLSDLWAQVLLLPDGPLSPVARAEWAAGLDGGAAVDAGVAWRPQDFLQLAATGRFDGVPGAYLGLSLFEDPGT